MTSAFYIKRALQLAKNGIGNTRPNPSVGAVIEYENKIIGEGYTSPYGGSHAEVNAINSVKDKTQLKEATMYVTLEPCVHYGKTPPCTNLIIKHQLKKVVIGCIDSHSLVAGKGVEQLKNAGIDVEVGVLEKECLKHHQRFFTFHNKKRPYIILKWAETQDGFIAPKSKKKQQPVWISNNYSQQIVHKWRSKEHAILVGTGTAIADNPTLNVRSWSGNNPIRVFLDRHLKISKNANLYDGSVKTIVLTEKIIESKDNLPKNLVFKKISFSRNVAVQIINILYQENIQSVIIEGGAQTLQTFIDANLWDEARVFTSISYFEQGVKAPCFFTKQISEEKILKDTLKTYFNN